MSRESYAESVRLPAAEREAKVAAVIAVLSRIINDYSRFEADHKGNVLALPGVPWEPDPSPAFAHLHLLGPGSNVILQAEALAAGEPVAAVACAQFAVSDGYKPAVVTTTFEMKPPNIRGYDSGPLTLLEIDGTMADLNYYESALHAGLGNEE